MLKKLLISSMLVLGMIATYNSGYAHSGSGSGSHHHHRNSYANFFNASTQVLPTGTAATFNNNNVVKNITLSGGNSIVFKNSGNYAITFTATGSESANGAQLVGPWSLGLFLNGNLVPGSVAAASSGTQGGDNLITLTTVGEVIIHVNRGDILQLRNTSNTEVTLEATVSGSTTNNAAVTINIVGLSR